MTKAPKSTAKPVPSQAKADDIRSESTDEATAKAADKAAKAKATDATPEAPFPSQADLDAMRAGTYGNREMKSV